MCCLRTNFREVLTATQKLAICIPAIKLFIATMAFNGVWTVIVGICVTLLCNCDWCRCQIATCVQHKDAATCNNDNSTEYECYVGSANSSCDCRLQQDLDIVLLFSVAEPSLGYDDESLLQHK